MRWSVGFRPLLALAVVGPVALPAQVGDSVAVRERAIIALADQGRSAAAESLALVSGPAYRVTLGALLQRRGAWTQAEALYQEVAAARSEGLRPALAGLAEIAANRGDRETAWRHALDLTGQYERDGRGWPARDKLAAGRGYALLGLGNPTAVRSALAAFDAAAASDSQLVEAQLLAADLLLARYNAPDALSSYLALLRQAPRHSRALFGVAQTMRFDGHPDATTAVRAALAENQELAPAWVALGQLHLEAEAYDSAAVSAARALALDSTSSATWGLVGAMAWLRDDTVGYRRAEAAASRHQPRSADFHVALGDAAARQRRYAEAVTFGRAALAIDTLSVTALDLLATNLLRQGEMVEGRRLLDRSMVLDPFNVRNENSLRLLDLVQSYKVVRTARFEIIASAREADYLALYLGPLLEAAYDTLARRYGYRPPTPIRLELYERHADFSVRTIAMVGLGALGVSFGPVLVMDSPRAREAGAFNYGSTAWHELAHTFTLGASGFRVPRWVSEGLSVLEERRAGVGWGAHATTAFLAAWRSGGIPPVSRLNDGLVRPTYPQQIPFTYFAASLVCEMIEERVGEAGLRAMLTGFRDGQDLAEVFQRVLGLAETQVDSVFTEWVERRYRAPLSGLQQVAEPGPPQGAFPALVERGAALLQAGAADSAFAVLQEAERFWPGYGGTDGPARWLARYHVDRGDTLAALESLARVTSQVEDAMELNRVEADWRAAVGDRVGALAALERRQWIAPYDLAAHARSAAGWEALGDWSRAVRERRAMLALDPPDKVEARYQLARVLAASGDRAAARREILEVLEQAPGFEPAQMLLLQLRQGGTP